MAALQHPAQTLASHLISQTLGSISAMENLAIITPDDAAAIRARLPNPYATFPQLAGGANQGTPVPGGLPNPVIPPAARESNNSFAAPPYSAGAGAVSPAMPPPGGGYGNAPGPGSGGHGQGHGGPGPELPRARALWDYNSSDAGDLQFRTGEIILIEEEVNAEWFRGRVEGRSPEKGGSGLFPSNYIEKLDEKAAPPPSFAAAPPPPQQQYYQPPGPPMGPQTPGGTMQPMQPGQAVQVQQDEQQQNHKPHKFGKLGNQLGNAAVSGAGFGFGASLAGNLVNNIF